MNLGNGNVGLGFNTHFHENINALNSTNLVIDEYVKKNRQYLSF